MSIEYTIDIQLTELGFPEILQSQETSVRETPCPIDPFSSSHSPTPLSATHKSRLLVGGQQSVDGKQATAALQTSDIETGRHTSFDPAHSLQQADKGTARPELSQPTVNDLTAGEATRENSSEQQKDAEDDSDDSEVSEVYEEEEFDEEEDDEDQEGVNNDSGEYHCSVCDLQLPSQFKLQDHMNLHTGARPYCCAECGKRFCQINNYRVHLRTHAQTKRDHFQCRICLMGFVSQEDLTDHLSKNHLQNEFYECDLCKRVFTSLKDCEYHVQMHKCMISVTCDVCGRSFSSSKSLARHQKRRCLRNFKCTDCLKTFTKKNALLKHSFSHLGLLPYTCVRCRRHFRLARLYRLHKCEPERIHCVACLREFLSQEDFQQHKKDTGCWGHQEPKGDEIRCLECGQRFDSTEELKRHAGAHQRVLKCADCGKGFRSALLLMSHMGGHAGKSPCLCQSCGLGFPHQQNYDSHLKTCGKTPQLASAPKKRPASKASPLKKKKPSAKPDSSNPTNTAAVPAAPVNDASSPAPETEDVSAGSSPPDGLWKLSLDRHPPPGAKLVLFLPVCQTQSDGLTIPSAASPTLPGAASQIQPQHLAAVGALPNPPLDLVTGFKQDPECEAPLDLSKKCNSSKSALRDIPPPPPVKSEIEETEISGQADCMEIQEFKNSIDKASVKPNPVGTDTNSDVMNLSTHNGNRMYTGLRTDTNEPQHPGLDCNSQSSRSSQLTEEENKVEADVLSPVSEK